MRNLFIIIEGPDAVGKSTLISNIKNYFNDFTLHMLHYSNVKQDTPEKTIYYSKKMYEEMFGFMLTSIKHNQTGIICDRSHLGEMVYGPIYRNYSGEYVIDIEKKYHNILDVWDNLHLITLIDDADRIIDRDKERGDGLSFSLDVEKKQTEIDNFIKAHHKSTIKNKLLVNINDKDADAVKNLVIDFIKG